MTHNLIIINNHGELLINNWLPNLETAEKQLDENINLFSDYIITRAIIIDYTLSKLGTVVLEYQHNKITKL